MCSRVKNFRKFIFIFSIFLPFGFTARVHLIFRDIQCKVNDPKLAEMVYCRLERNTENISTLSVRFKNMGAWTNETIVTLKYMRKVSATRYVNYIAPLKYNFCKFIGDEYNMLLRILFRSLQTYSNINGSCPLTASDISVDNFPIDDRLLFWMPVQRGEYMAVNNYLLNNVSIVELYVYLKQQK